MNARFIKFGRFVINPNLIASIVIADDGSSRVILSGGGEPVRLSAEDTQKLLTVITPLGS
jgi:hypothetical protein